MKATTTVTTSTYYSQSSKTNAQMLAANFISPQQMLKRLIPYSNTQNNKQNINTTIKAEQNSSQILTKNILVSDIQKLQYELNNIHAQIIESQNLLNVRDSLYGQMDMLREQRQQVQNDIGYFQNEQVNSQTVKINFRQNQGYKEMNERLRRRMNEVRQYIHKMQLQNRKIEENINYTNALVMDKNYRTQAQMNSTTWVDNAYFNDRERGMNRVDDLINRVHVKQQEALQRVRRQEQEIDRRNQLNRASFNNVVTSQTAARSYYGPSTGVSNGGRRFYSPEYKY